MKKKIALLMAIIMLFGVTMGATIAWLTAESLEVKNTFTFGDIKIALDEADVNDVDNDGDVIERVQNNAYDLIPGATASKDPTVTVDSDSEKCYVFVKITETNNTISGLTGKVIGYDVDANWVLVPGYTDLYVWSDNSGAAVEVVPSSDVDSVREDIQLDSVIDNKTITVNKNLTSAQIKAMEDAEPDTTPILAFDAAAVQSENIPYSDSDDNVANDVVSIAAGLLSATKETN